MDRAAHDGTAATGGESPDPLMRAREELQARLRSMQPAPAFPTLDELVIEIAALRPLPAIAYRVLELSEDARFSAHDLATLIAQDQALTAKLLRLANSAYYGHVRRIHTVRDAVVLLGVRAVRSAAIATCLMDGGRRATHVDADAFWMHSVTTAMLGELLARSEGASRDHAFTAGILHNVGVLALDQQRPELLGPVVDRAREHSIPLAEAAHAVLGFSDVDLGAALAQHWGFPPGLVEAVRGHRTALGGAGEPTPRLASYVARARQLVRAHGIPDGVLDGVAMPSAAEQAAPVPRDVERVGDMEALLGRVDAFLAASLA